MERKQVRYPDQNYQVFYVTSDGRPVCWTEEGIRRYQEQVGKMKPEQKGSGA